MTHRGGGGEALSERDALATLASVEGVGPVTLALLFGRHGSAAAVFDAARHGHLGGVPDGVAGRIRVAAADPETQLAPIRALGLEVLDVRDAAYPGRLLEIEAPPVLFVRGSVAALSSAHAVAVVGTRRPTEPGRRVAARIATALVRAGATVISGLAVGIDGAAHAATLAAGGRTVAVIGGGHAVLTPPVHRRLADAIVAAGGAIVSEYPPATVPERGTFPRRNRIVSGLADAAVVVEAGARSGALITASWALEQGRECFLVPGPIDAPASAGCLGFLRDWPGAARIVAGVPQLLDDLGLPGAAGLPGAPTNVSETGPGRRDPAAVTGATAEAIIVELVGPDALVADALVRGAVTVDELVAACGLTVGTVLGALTRLEARGLAGGEHGRYHPAGLLDARRRRPARPGGSR